MQMPDRTPIIPHVHLGELTIGEQATIVGYDKEHLRYLHRLLAMGLTRGTKILLVRKAPMGDPLDISLRGYNISLRRDEASVLRLERTP